MNDNVKQMVEAFEEKYELLKPVKTPAAEHLFQINENYGKPNEEIHEDFHTYTAKSLFICKRVRPDMQTAVAFMTTRVIELDTNDWKNCYD